MIWPEVAEEESCTRERTLGVLPVRDSVSSFTAWAPGTRQRLPHISLLQGAPHSLLLVPSPLIYNHYRPHEVKCEQR